MADNLNTSAIHTNNKQEFWLKLLRFNLFVQDIDLFAVPKSSSESIAVGRNFGRPIELAEPASSVLRESSPTSQHVGDELLARRSSESVELNLARLNSDQTRKRITKVLRLFVGLVLARNLLIAYVQYSLIRKDQPISALERSLLFSVATCNQLTQLLANPLASLKDLAITLYVGPALYTLSLMTTMHHYYKLQPFGNALLSFVLDRDQELGRLDSRLRLHLARLRESLQNYAWERRIAFQQARSLLLPDLSHSFRAKFMAWNELNKREMEEKSYSGQIICLLAKLYSEPARVRPDNLRPEQHEKMRHLTAVLALVGLITCGFLSINNLLPLLWIPYRQRCPTLSCNPFHVLEWRELLLASEMLVVISLGTLIFLGNMMHLTLLVINQLAIIDSSRLVLRDYSERARSHRWAPRLGDGQPNGCQELRLAEILARLIINSDQLKQNSACLSLEAAQHLAVPISGILTASLQTHLRVQSTFWFRYYLILFTWFEFNLMLISCAFIESRLLQLQRDLWRFSASISVIHGACYKTEFDDPRNISLSELQLDRLGRRSFVLDRLAKFLRLFNNGSWPYCPKILGVTIDYRKIFRANFFVVLVFAYTFRDGRKP